MKDSGRTGKRKKSVIFVIITAFISVLIVAALLITNIFIPLKYLGAYFVKPHKNVKGELRVNFLNVGFGDCTLIELPDGKSILIDGGDGDYSNVMHVLKVLNYRGVDKIDYLVCTSVKGEHCGGLAEIVKYKEVGFAYIPYCLNPRITTQYASFISAIEEDGVQYAYARAGEHIIGEDYYFTFLSPSDGGYAEMNQNPDSANIENASAVSCLECGGVSFIFTSDIRWEGLKRITDDYNTAVGLNVPYCAAGGYSVKLEECKIVTAPAHAGKDSTYASWYNLIKPEQVVISVGKNYADYPSDAALSDIGNYCTPRYTMYDGDITVTVKNGGYTIN